MAGRVRVSGGAAFAQRPCLPEKAGIPQIAVGPPGVRRHCVPPFTGGAGPARKRKRLREKPEERDARDWLHAELDSLGDSLPSEAKFSELLTLSFKAFQKGTVARRMIVLLLRMGRSNQ